MNGRTVARFVLMRFNVTFPGFEHLDINDRTWLDYRLRLAELTAFHSLRQQSLKDFTLVMMIDPATPESFITALQAATQDIDTIIVQGESALPQSLASVLLDNTDPDCPAIQTSRIDSDDMFHPDYLRNIDEFCTQNDLFPKLARSPRYFMYPDGQDYLMQSATCNRIIYPDNAFGTLIEPRRDSVLTVLCDGHKRMSKRFVTYAIDGPPMWCRILHGANLASKPRKPVPLPGHIPVHPELAEFAKLPTVHPPKKYEPAPRPAM